MSTIHDIWYQTFLIQHDIMLNEMGMTKYSQIKYISIVDTSNSLFIIKNFHGKFHHNISQRLVKFHYLYRLLTIQEIDINNPKHNILQLYIILFIVIEEEYQLSQIENKSRKLNNTNIQWNLWHVISLQLQHGGMSDGGGSIWASRCLPFFTMNAVSMPQVTWQCRNHTPATEKI